MHFVVKAPNLAHMYMTPKKKYLAIVPSQISPVGAVAAIFKNGRYLTISQKLRGVALSLSTPYIGFLGRRFQKNYCRIYHAIVSAILEPILKMAAISQVNWLILETLRHRIVTLVSTHIIYGQYNSDNVWLRAPHKCMHSWAACCGYLL